jgi:DNA-binding SARP family transcriptional activator
MVARCSTVQTGACGVVADGLHRPALGGSVFPGAGLRSVDMGVVVRLLGPLEVDSGGRTVAVNGAKERALVVALALAAPRVASIDGLIAAVWGTEPPPSARASLRVLIARLRKALTAAGALDALVTRPHGYQLQADDVDVREFERLSRQGRAELAGGRPAAAVTLRQALGLWRGDCLAESSTEPLRVESARLEHARLATLEARLEADLACGRHEELTGELTALCAAHPLREHLWALCITALYRSGRQADALAAYREVRTILDEELGIRPVPELRRLEAAVLAQDDGLAAPTRPQWTHNDHSPGLSPRLAGLRRSALVGRVGPMAALQAAWDATADGRTALALLSGEPGIGKSRLLAELAAGLREEGVVVLYGRCDDQLDVPCQPVAEWLEQVLHGPGGALLAEADPRRLAALARLVPAIAEHVPRPPTTVLDPDSMRFELAAAVATLLQRLATAAPLVLISDDLHWADHATVQLLRHLLQQPIGRVLLLAAHREVEDPAVPLVELLGALPPELPVTRVPLTGLDLPDVRTLVGTAADHPKGPDRLAALLHEATGGNPFYVTEVLRHLRETGGLDGAADDHWSSPAALLAAGVPTGLRAVLRGRLARLDAPTRELLSVAAVMGQEFDVDVLARAIAVHEDAVLDGLEAAQRAAFVGEDAQVDGRFHFNHALVRLTLDDELGHTRRSRVHGRIAEAIEALCGTQPGDRIGELARHALAGVRGGTAATAVRHGLAAARRALDTGAPEEAASWYAQVLAVLGSDPDDATRARSLIGLGIAQRMAGRAEFRDTLVAAADLARQLGRGDLLVDAALEVNRGSFSNLGRRDAGTIRLLEEALAVPDQAPARRAHLCAALSAELSFDPDVTRRRALAEEAVALARAGGDPLALLDALTRPNPALMIPELLSERVGRLEEAVTLAEELGDRVARFWALHGLALARLEDTDIAGVQELLRTAGRDVGEVREPNMIWSARFISACFELVGGDLRTAERQAEEARELGLASGQPDAEAIYQGQLFVIRWHQGRLGEALPANRALAAALPDFPAIAASCALAEVLSGSETMARRMLTTTARQAFAFPETVARLPALHLWAQVAAELGEREIAVVLDERLQPWHTLFTTSGPTPFESVALPLARLAALLDRPGPAESYFAEALTVHERVRAPFGIAATVLHWGTFAVDQGDDARGRQRLARAAAIADQHGYGLIGQRARQVLGNPSGVSPVSARRP